MHVERRRLTIAEVANAYRTAALNASGLWENHREACETRQMKLVLQSLDRKEILWLKNLPDEVKMELCGDEDVEEFFRFNHHLTFVQYALVLGNVLPCHYSGMGLEGGDWAGYTVSFEESVLRPWFSKYQDFLEKKGFRLDSFEDPLEFGIDDYSQLTTKTGQKSYLLSTLQLSE